MRRRLAVSSCDGSRLRPVAAGVKNLIAYQERHGINTIAGIVARRHLAAGTGSGLAGIAGIDVSTLAGWVGSSTTALVPMVLAIRAHVFAAAGSAITMIDMAETPDELSPCTLMFNAVDASSFNFSQLNSTVVRGHAHHRTLA